MLRHGSAAPSDSSHPRPSAMTGARVPVEARGATQCPAGHAPVLSSRGPLPEFGSPPSAASRVHVPMTVVTAGGRPWPHSRLPAPVPRA